MKVLRRDRYVMQKIRDHEGPRTTTTATYHMKPRVVNEEEDVVEDGESAPSDSENIWQWGQMSYQNDQVWYHKYVRVALVFWCPAFGHAVGVGSKGPTKVFPSENGRGV